MPTTPLRNANKGRWKRKNPSAGTRGQRAIDRVAAAPESAHPIDATIDRRFPERALRARIRRITAHLMKALGPRQNLWLNLEAALEELKSKREDAYFDLGFEHGFAAGCSAARRSAGRAREIGARLRNFAIQHGGQEHALSALLEAATALCVQRRAPGTKHASNL